MTDWSPEQIEALQIARDLIDLGVPIFTAKPNHGDRGGEFILPSAWPTFRPHQAQVDMWRPGDALCMVTGVVYDVIDVDPRNGGAEGIAELAEVLEWDRLGGPAMYGKAMTPSTGEHLLIGRTGLRKGKPAKGIDLQAGDRHGEGRGFVYIAPTVRVSKYGPDAGHPVAYRWASAPTRPRPEADAGLDRFVAYVEGLKPASRSRAKVDAATNARAITPADDDAAAFDYATDWTAAEADRMIQAQLQAVEDAKAGEVNGTLGGAARVLGRFVAGGYLTEDDAVNRLILALDAGGVHSDQWNRENRLDWTAAGVIGVGLANGAEEPWTVEPAPEPEPGAEGTIAPGSAQEPARVIVATPRLEVGLGAGEMAYWLQNVLGSGPLSGFFLRDGRVVHTPLVDEAGYVAPRGAADDNGPAQIQAVGPGQLAAKIQYAYSCYKTIKGKDGKPDTEVPALFPLQAAQRAIDAPESMSMLRGLAGITLTPMVRADGSILERPGYDPATRYLFLPGPGVHVKPVPAEPTDAEVDAAVALLDEMLAEFPWESKDDRANYFGLLLTPMLRLVTPPSYKMFGIGAHQPGSGKTLLADIVTTLHGGVLRSETPEDEPEWRKQITSILSTTSAPVVLIDNVTGVLKSSSLAGTLTASQPVTDRELGSTRMVTTINDRVWLVTGNNLSLGGDLVRRTITIMIDPNRADPETREFAIPDLAAWVQAHSNELRHALLVMIRRWVAAGRPEGPRAQSDSYARWERTVAGILAACGVDGDFDAQSGKRASRGGDDDGLSETLAHLRDRFGDRAWTVVEALDGTESAELGDFIAAGRDWLPSVVLDKLARSETAGRKSLGYWLRNRVGRWVNDADGRSLVIREAGRTKTGMGWRIEQA